MKTCSPTSSWGAILPYVSLPIIIAIFFAGCHPLLNREARGEVKMDEQSTVALKKEDSGREISVKLGDIIEVELFGMGSAGYGWYVEGMDEEVLQLVSEETKPGPAGRLGAPVLGIWKFRTRRQGAAELRMYHYRQWEGIEKSTDHFAVKIKIR